MIIDKALIMILIVMNVVFLMEKNRFKLILLFSIYSLIASMLYFIYSAPDVALSEIVIGSALIPLIYTIGISKQQKLSILLFNSTEEIHRKISKHCEMNDLKLKYLTKEQLKDYYAVGVFSTITVDVILRQNDGIYEVEVIEGSHLCETMENLFKKSENVHIKKVNEFEI